MARHGLLFIGIIRREICRCFYTLGEDEQSWELHPPPKLSFSHHVKSRCGHSSGVALTLRRLSVPVVRICPRAKQKLYAIQGVRGSAYRPSTHGTQ